VYLAEWRELWFFPRHDGVEGWQGTLPVFFVGLAASTGHFPDRATRHLYKQMRKCGFERAHLTDLVKERATSESAKAILQDDEKMARYREYFLEELRILNPRLIVGMGYEAQCFLDRWLAGDLRLRCMPHYSPRYWNRRKQYRIAKALRERAAECKSLGLLWQRVKRHDARGPKGGSR
jgi:hypothetical protein